MYLSLLFSALALGISFFSLFYFRSYLKRRTGQERILAEMRDEVNNILRTIDETTERDISLVEERENNLKSLLNDIEKRLKVYVREMEKLQGSEKAFAALTLKKPDAPVSPDHAEKIYRELGKNRFRFDALTQNSETVAEPPPVYSAARSQSNQNQAFPLPAFSIKPENSSSATVGEQVGELLRAGFSVPVIATRLGFSIAEVEFAAALLERREAK
jgi:hypothetical protein